MQKPQRINKGTTEDFSFLITMNLIMQPETKIAIMLLMYQ